MEKKHQKGCVTELKRQRLDTDMMLKAHQEEMKISKKKNRKCVKCDGVGWSVVECGGVGWSVVECGGVWGSVVECGRVWWSVVEFGGEGWSVVECGGVWWSVVKFVLKCEKFMNAWGSSMVCLEC